MCCTRYRWHCFRVPPPWDKVPLPRDPPNPLSVLPLSPHPTTSTKNYPQSLAACGGAGGKAFIVKSNNKPAAGPRPLRAIGRRPVKVSIFIDAPVPMDDGRLMRDWCPGSPAGGFQGPSALTCPSRHWALLTPNLHPVTPLPGRHHSAGRTARGHVGDATPPCGPARLWSDMRLGANGGEILCPHQVPPHVHTSGAFLSPKLVAF